MIECDLITVNLMPVSLQVRQVECQAGIDGRDRQVVPHAFCLDAGLSASPTSQPCGLIECPQWRTTSWQDVRAAYSVHVYRTSCSQTALTALSLQCETSECFGLDTAVQRRQVTCAFLNDSTVSDEQCTSAGMARPRDGRDCVNYKCKAVWTTGPWSQVQQTI